jgi:Tfp pilus assembly ATPase PilU
VAALGILVVTPAISSLIREVKTFQIPGMLQVGKKFGMQTLDDAIMGLLNKKIISPEDAYNKSHDKNSLTPYSRIHLRNGCRSSPAEGTPGSGRQMSNTTDWSHSK